MKMKTSKPPIKNHLIPYKGKENVKWEIRWDIDNSIFAFFLYIKEEDVLMKRYRILIPNEIIKSSLGRKERINDIVEICIDKIKKLYGVNFREY